jgi:hypothetical protein
VEVFIVPKERLQHGFRVWEADGLALACAVLVVLVKQFGVQLARDVTRGVVKVNATGRHATFRLGSPLALGYDFALSVTPTELAC